MIFEKKVKDEIKTLFLFLLNFDFLKFLSRTPKFEYPPLLTRAFIPRTLSKLLEGTLLVTKIKKSAPSVPRI